MLGSTIMYAKSLASGVHKNKKEKSWKTRLSEYAASTSSPSSPQLERIRRVRTHIASVERLMIKVRNQGVSSGISSSDVNEVRDYYLSVTFLTQQALVSLDTGSQQHEHTFESGQDLDEGRRCKVCHECNKGSISTCECCTRSHFCNVLKTILGKCGDKSGEHGHS